MEKEGLDSIFESAPPKEWRMYKILLCLRYLRTRYIALASIISVMLGVATMIVVNSVMSGFSTQMRDRIHNILADMVLEARSNQGEPDAELCMAKIREVAGEYIEALSPTVETWAMLTVESRGDSYTKPVNLVGIDPATKSKVGKFTEHLGNYQEERDGERIIKQALKPLGSVPDWELSSEAMQERRVRSEFQHTLIQRHHPELRNQSSEQEQEEGEETASNEGMPEDPFATEDARRPLTAEELAAPQDGRLYVGLGLISWQDFDQKTGKDVTRMVVRPGEDVRVSSLTAGSPPTVVSNNATIVDTFRSGMAENDTLLVFANLDFVQNLRGMYEKDAQGKISRRYFSTIQIKLKDYANAQEVEKRLRTVFPANRWDVRTWEEKQGTLLAAVAVESAILNILLFLIIAVAGFGILAIFFMIVVEKTRDIGILKALGASSRGVQSIFLSYGLALGLVGSGVGVVLGMVFVWNINTIEAFLTWITGQKMFDERIYYFSEIPTNTSPVMVFWVALGAIAIAVMASIFPARRAARLNPVESLRYE